MAVENLLREVRTQSAEETIAFGRALVDLLAPPKLVLLRGDLGAGKTTLVKGIAAAFEAAAEEDVTSPTFTLVHEYRGPRANLFHIDLYRIDTARELDTLALDDLRGEASILLIEWGEKFPRLVRERDVEIALEREGESGRRIRVSGWRYQAMSVLKYEPVVQQTRESILEALDSGDPDEIHRALESAAYWDPDWRWAQAQLLRFSDHESETVLWAVALGFTFLAVFHGEVDEGLVMPILARIKERPRLKGVVEDVEEDIQHFVINRRKGANVSLARRLRD